MIAAALGALIALDPDDSIKSDIWRNRCGCVKNRQGGRIK